VTEVHTHLLQPGEGNLQVYGALDAAITVEIHQALEALGKNDNLIYDFERALQAPAVEMMARGFLVDPWARQEGITYLGAKLRDIDSRLQRLAIAIWGKALNPRSNAQMKEFFYEVMRLPPQYALQKGVRRVSCNRDSLEKLEVYLHARPLISLILSYRDSAKQLEVLRTQIDPDGRMRTAYNIAGTETGRWSSSASSTGTGGNLQNITADLRHIFIADPGWRLVGIDLEQAESREVGWQCGTLFGDWGYLDACERGDLHTAVCQLTWPELPWRMEASHDRELAERKFYRGLSRRDMAKKLGHGSNYGGAPFTLARHAKIPKGVAEEFQKRYFKAFPAIPRWHRWVAQQLQTEGELTTPFGRTRRFFGRPTDDSTLREAIAFVPQSSTGDRMNLGLWRLWKYMGKEIRLLAQVHDAVYALIPEDCDHGKVIAQMLQHIDVTLSHGGRNFSVPGEAKMGWNGGNVSVTNPNGLAKWKGHDPRTFVEAPNLLDRRL